MLNEEIQKYLETSKEIMKKYVPPIMINPGIALGSIIISHKSNIARTQALKTLAEQSDYFRYKYLRNAKSNNWLRTHGYPMRRKGH